MKRQTIIFATILALVATTAAQSVTDSVYNGKLYIGPIGDEEEYADVYYTTPPEFPGGKDSLYMFLEKNMQLPNGCYEIDGIVYVQFNVEKDGSITNIMVKRDVGHGLGQKVVRVVQLMPKWKPATYKGTPVALLYMLPVKFSLH